MARRSIPQAGTTGDLELPQRLQSAPDAEAPNATRSPAEQHAETVLPAKAEQSAQAEQVQQKDADSASDAQKQQGQAGRKPQAGQPAYEGRLVQQGRKLTQESEAGRAGQPQVGQPQVGQPQPGQPQPERGPVGQARSWQNNQAEPGKTPAGDEDQAQSPAQGVAAAAVEGAKQAREAAEKQEQQKRIRRFTILKRASIVFAAIMAVVLIALGVFSWNRWYRFDDAADMLGEWYVAGTDVAITIDQEAIHFDEKTAYEYTLDTDTKTVTFSLANLEGKAHYWFADERRYLVITDGDAFTKWGTAFSDLGADLGVFFTLLTGGQLTLPSGEGIIVLSREADAVVAGVGDSQSPSGASGETESQGASSVSADASDASSNASDSGASGASDEAGASASAAATKDIFSQVNDKTAPPQERSEGAEEAFDSQEITDSQETSARETDSASPAEAAPQAASAPVTEAESE